MQTYATCRALRELGHEVEIVDIRQPEPKHEGFASLLVRLVYAKRNHNVQSFKSIFYPPLTKHYFSVDELRQDPPYVDCLMVGSDQTWNPDISKEMAMAYFLDFGADNIRRISYASSFGIDAWPKMLPITNNVRKAFERFNFLSVREKTGISILKESFGKDGVLVVDPTMLFTDYTELVHSIPQRKEVICYQLHRTPEFFHNIGTVKEKTGLPLRLLNNSFPVHGFRYTYPPSVSEWIKRIGGATFVVTDSFHGTVFSLLYKRNFVAIKSNNGKDSRLVDLLESVGLQCRLYDSVAALKTDDSWLQAINYSPVDEKVACLREKSWDYLTKAIG